MTNPILLLPYQPHEFVRKTGGGSQKPPIVEITADLRSELSGQLERLADHAKSSGATRTDPLPVKIKLREQALAKSNRPYAFLAQAALPAVAAGRPGELIVEGTADRLQNLSSLIRTSDSKKDLYDISTFETFSGWNVLVDGFRRVGDESADSVVQAAREAGKTLRLTFFPWVARRLEHAVMPQGVVSGHDGSHPRTEVVGALSELTGLNVEVASATSGRPVAYVRPSADLTADRISQVRGIRSMSVTPEYAPIRSIPQGMRPIRTLTTGEVPLPGSDAPVVAVLDSGVDSTHLENAVVKRVEFDPVGLRNPEHGTFVAGLVMSAGHLNGGGDFPDDSSHVIDAQVLPNGTIDEPLLLERIEDVVRRNPQVKVWNCSFGAPTAGIPEYGPFAQELDALSQELGVLFVQAAGNYEGRPARGWPPVDLDDLLMSPAEAVRSLTVGARAHKGGLVQAGAPASYSRRGPNFAAHVKPEVCHWAGDLDQQGYLGGFGVQSLLPSGELAEGIGTSFSTPVVSTIAANVWARLEAAGATTVRPELIKGLLVHAASLRDTTTEPDYRNYYGWGVPPSSTEVLSNLDSEFTTVHEVVLTPGNKWFKRPFPVPASLLTDTGKFRGEVVMTLSYAPVLNPAFGSEAVREDVAGAFGRFQTPGDSSTFKAITSPQPSGGAYWEADQIEDGKWAPVKTYRGRYPNGVAGGEWALRLTPTERVSDEVAREQRVFVFITFRGIDPNVQVYQDGVRAVRAMRYPSRNMTLDSTVRIGRQS